MQHLRTWLVHAVLLAAIARLVVPVLTTPVIPLAQQPFPDAAEYADAATQIAHGHGYVTLVHGNEPQPPRYPPGFSLALAPFAAIGTSPENLELGVRVFAAVYVLGAIAAGWSLGGPLAALVTALLITQSPFARYTGLMVLTHALAAALTVLLMLLVRSSRSSRALVAGCVAGLLTTIRLSDGLTLPALLVAAAPRSRLAILLGAAPLLLALAAFQWHTFGSPFRTGYDYWAPGVSPFDPRYALVRDAFGDAADVVPDRLEGALMQWVCPCGPGGPLATAPDVLAYPAVLLGLFWSFTPPLVTLVGLAYAWRRWRADAGGRFSLVLTLFSLAFYSLYYYQAIRFLAGPATLLAIYSAVGISDWSLAGFAHLCRLRRRVEARLATPGANSASK